MMSSLCAASKPLIPAPMAVGRSNALCLIQPRVMCSSLRTAQPLLRTSIVHPAPLVRRPSLHPVVPARVPGCPASSSTSPASPGPAPASSPAKGLRVTLYIGLWYGFNIVFNILNKSALNAFPAPWCISALQLATSAVFMGTLWITRLYPAPTVTWPLIKALAPVALAHTIGHVSACVSFSLMAVSFAHVVKAAEPVLSVALSQLILGEVNPWYVWASLLPIIGGCSLSAMKEVSFAWAGFNNAMISNFGMVMRNVLSKKSLGDATNKLDGTNLFALLSFISLVYTVPVALAVEGFKGGVFQWGTMWSQAVATLGAPQFYKLMAGAGIFYHLYNQASYMVLDQGISPVTFSVGNTMKRVAVVASSVLFFRNPVSALNWIGSMLAIAGTGLYSLAKQKAGNDAKKAKPA
ncbi:CGL51 [Auxenochlorella protothecoides x Auxenochlorella symbiontica]|uniref:Sugar phosphate transporter domain-containing protein n=3 Tax=Auxenochlorella protothecoides TaxID=3075 RepID=A0A1D1ZYR8_AUXPR